jgi:ribosomal protein S27E
MIITHGQVMNVYTTKIKQSNPPTNQKPIKCPECKRGRVCDVSLNAQVTNTEHETDKMYRFILYLKCPKCGNPVCVAI